MLDKAQAAAGRIIVVGDCGLFPIGWRDAFANNNLEIVHRSATLSEALLLIRITNLTVDLILCDHQVMTNPDFVALKNITKDFPDVATVILTHDVNAAGLALATDCGARGFLPIDISATALSLTLQLILLGENIFAATPGVAMERPLNSRKTWENAHETETPAAAELTDTPRRFAIFRRGKPAARK